MRQSSGESYVSNQLSQLYSGVRSSPSSLFFLACLFDDHIRQALTTQSDLKATEACIRFDTRQKIHLVDTDSANAARILFCWKWDSPDHFSRDCPHVGAVKDLIAKRNAPLHSGLGVAIASTGHTPLPRAPAPRPHPQVRLPSAVSRAFKEKPRYLVYLYLNRNMLARFENGYLVSTLTLPWGMTID